MNAQAYNEMPGDCDLALLREGRSVDLLKALSDPSRLAVLVSLASAGGPLRVTEIGTCCPQDLSVVSRHLAILRRAGVVESERRGREVWYRVRREEVVRALRDIADALERCCADSGVPRADGGAMGGRVEEFSAEGVEL